MKKKALTRAGAALMAGALLATSAGTAFAATSNDSNNTTDVVNDLANSDIIDEALTGSISIYKYDITAASEAGVYNEGDITATGQQDTTLEKKLDDYAIAGVEFTYLRVGDIEQYSVTTADGGTQLMLVYEIPTALADILELDGVTDTDDDTSNDAVDMSGNATKCDNTGVLHYTSDQINEALETILTNDDIAAKNALEEYVESLNETGYVTDDNKNDATKSHTLEQTDADGYTGIDGLDLGLYLIVETAVPEHVTDTVDPFFVSIPMTNVDDTSDVEDGTTEGGTKWFYDITVYPKNQTGNPSLDKLVRNATGVAADTAGESETLDYIVSNLTDMFETYGYQMDNTSAAEFVADRGDATYSTTNNGVNTMAGAGEVDTDNDGLTDADNTSDGETVDKALDSAETVVGEYQYASTTTASAGDVIDYILVSKIPHITSEATYLTEYTFTDNLSAGLTYNKDAKIAFYTNAADAYINNTANAVMIWSADGITYTLGGGATHSASAESLQDYADITAGIYNGGVELTVSFTDKGLELINGDNTLTGTYGYSDYYMVVYYTATVDSDSSLVLGDDGNSNNVMLEWSRTSDGWYDTLEDMCYVYSYGLDLTKLFSDNGGDYEDVTFNMYNKTDGYYVVAEYNKDDEVYYVTGKSASQADATVFVVNGSGKLLVYGLEGDCYSITELSTTSGYALLADQVVVDITTASRSIQAAVAGWTGQYDDEGNYIDGDNRSGKVAMVVGDVVSGSATVDGVSATMLSDTYTSYSGQNVKNEDTKSINAIVSLTITNTKNFTLPLTGGAGLYVVTILGVLAVAGGCWMAFGKKKENDNVMVA